MVETQDVVLVRNFVPFTSLTSILLYSPIEFLQGMLRPFPDSFRSYIFFIESLAQIFLITFLLLKNWGSLARSPEFYIVFLTFAMGIVLNSLIIENEFTYARYKYTFIYCFIIFLISKNKKDIPLFNYFKL